MIVGSCGLPGRRRAALPVSVRLQGELSSLPANVLAARLQPGVVYVQVVAEVTDVQESTRSVVHSCCIRYTLRIERTAYFVANCVLRIAPDTQSAVTGSVYSGLCIVYWQALHVCTVTVIAYCVLRIAYYGW